MPSHFLARLAARSLARRAAVRFSADAFAAFRARAVRSSGVMFFAAVLPPCLPNRRAISVMAARTVGGILMAITKLMVQLTGYAGGIRLKAYRVSCNLSVVLMFD